MTDLIALRRRYEDLHGNGELEFMSESGKIPFAFRRGDLVMYFNPLALPFTINTRYDGDVIYKIGTAEIIDGVITMQPQSFLMIKTN